MRQLSLFHGPEGALGRLATALSHPLTIARTLLRWRGRRRDSRPRRHAPRTTFINDGLANLIAPASFSNMQSAQESIAAYIRAKDENRPYLWRGRLLTPPQWKWW